MDLTAIPHEQKCSQCDKYGYTSRLTKDLTVERLCVDHVNSSRLG